MQSSSDPPLLIKSVETVSQTFIGAIAQLKTLVLQDFDREIVEKQLCYHTCEHVTGVQRRASRIFQAIRPYWPTSEDCDRLEQLLDLSAIAHDLVQIFLPTPEPHTTRRREAGVSETATIEKLFRMINSWDSQGSDPSAQFSDRDRYLIQDAIAATICAYDPVEQAIFQPALYDAENPSSPIARILALADLNTLAMEGIAAYNQEGTLLFLEENLEMRSLIQQHSLEFLAAENPALAENIRQRLLKRARFQVNFAKSRLQRLPQELQPFPVAAIPILLQEVFSHLTPETIQQIEATTPTADDTSFDRLIAFFGFW